MNISSLFQVRIDLVRSSVFSLMICMFLFSFDSFSQKKTVVICLIDGLELTTARTAAQNGAANLKFIFENGVTAEEAYCPSPATRVILEDKTEPWGGTTGPNISIHTGCHMLESRNMDDIFLSAREKGIKSVFAGGSKNYNVITTPDFYYSGDHPDKFIVQKGIDHFTKDNTRLIRLHLQRIRDAWSGPSNRTDPTSAYIKSVVAADAELGRLITFLKEAGAWDSTYLIVTSDHGMGNSSRSDHPGTVLSSWSFFMGFLGPGIKQGKTIPYAENTDIAILAAHLLDLRPLKGHLDPKTNIQPKGPTGTLLTNIFVGAPQELNHPKPILSYLKSVNMKPGGRYLDYRNGILPFLTPTTAIKAESGQNCAIPAKKAWVKRGNVNYVVEKASHVNVNIFNLRGELITTLINRHHEQGTYTIDFSPINSNRMTNIQPGKYLVQIDIDRKHYVAADILITGSD